MGNLTRDPELRTLPKGTAICAFGLAINRDWKSESGEKQSEVCFVDCEAWGKTAETIQKYVTKGRPLYVQGRLKLDQWEDKKTSEKKSRIKVVVEQFQFLGSNKEEGAASNGAPEEGHRQPPPRAGGPAKPAAVDDGDSVPF